jgi:hypothetical protein
MNRGDIETLKDIFGDKYYRIYTGDAFGQFYSTDCYKTALKASNELKENI